MGFSTEIIRTLEASFSCKKLKLEKLKYWNIYKENIETTDYKISPVEYVEDHKKSEKDINFDYGYGQMPYLSYNAIKEFIEIVKISDIIYPGCILINLNYTAGEDIIIIRYVQNNDKKSDFEIIINCISINDSKSDVYKYIIRDREISNIQIKQ
jgi:hypothetical protein